MFLNPFQMLPTSLEPIWSLLQSWRYSGWPGLVQLWTLNGENVLARDLGVQTDLCRPFVQLRAAGGFCGFSSGSCEPPAGEVEQYMAYVAFPLWDPAVLGPV